MTPASQVSVNIAGLVVLLLAVVSLAGLVWLWWRVLRRPKQETATCGQCGYSVEGLTAFSCPECGADLRQAGIRPAPRRGAFQPWTFVALWTLLLLFPALIVSILALKMLPQQFTTTTYTYELTPNSGAYAAVDVKLDVRGATPAVAGNTAWRPRAIGKLTVVTPGTAQTTGPIRLTKPTLLAATVVMLPVGGQVTDIELVLHHHDGRRSQLRYVPGRDGAYQDRSGNKVALTWPVQSVEIAVWLADAGVFTASDIKQEADELAQMVAVSTQGATTTGGGMSAFTNTGFIASNNAADIVVIGGLAVLLCWAIVWLVGFRVYLRIRRRGLQPAVGNTTSPAA